MAERLKKNLTGSVQELLQKLGKFKYVPVILVLGIALMLLPTHSDKDDVLPQTALSEQFDLERTQKQLTALLSSVDGAGKVEVMLTLSASSEQVYQTDENRRSEQDGDDLQTTTVFFQSGSSSRTPVVRKTLLPIYRGAVVVCEGAQSAAVRLAIIEAVSDLTGLGSDKISVIKMKRQ